jgi:hypothetical protein
MFTVGWTSKSVLIYTRTDSEVHPTVFCTSYFHASLNSFRKETGVNLQRVGNCTETDKLGQKRDKMGRDRMGQSGTEPGHNGTGFAPCSLRGSMLPALQTPDFTRFSYRHPRPLSGEIPTEEGCLGYRLATRDFQIKDSTTFRRLGPYYPYRSCCLANRPNTFEIRSLSSR